jgi:hypothetical protein
MAAEKDDQDRIVEEELRNERKVRQDPTKSSIEPEFLQKINPDKQKRPLDEDLADQDFEDLSSDKEKDTTEGEITDTHTSE